MNALQALITDPTMPLPAQAVEWTAADQRNARKHGWGIFNEAHTNEPAAWEIARAIEHDRFRTDDEAVVHVLRRSHDREFGSLDRKAIAYIRATNPEFYAETVLEISARLGL